MQPTALATITGATMRANPGYQLVRFEQLSPAQRESLAPLQQDPDLVGLLLPRGGYTLAAKAVGRDTAQLFTTLQQPGPLPASLCSSFGERSNQALAELVLDQVLELACEGGFVAGARAYNRVFARAGPPQPQNALSELALAALKYGQALALTDPMQLSLRLYCFNRAPITALWRRRLDAPGAMAGYLGLRAGGPHVRTLASTWRASGPQTGADAWLSWYLPEAVAARQERPLCYKLYISPHSAALRENFGTILEVLAAHRVPSFKVGNDAQGLLRPDKLVAYFADFAQLSATAEQLREALEAVPAQGVPFSAALSADGMLSWGIDPPPEQAALPWQGQESWRLWVTNRLATSLVAAQAEGPTEVEPWQFALSRLRLEGVDTDSWAPPDPALWHV